MKLLVFAHVPPPHHGQSYMVQLMLNGFGGDCRKSRNKSGARNRYGIECYHVNARFSKSLDDVGELQIGKVPLILFYCLQAIWCRFRYGVTNFYYVPAPGKSVALYRDWLVMFLCRPFFKKIILHWHAAGLAKWLETVRPNPHPRRDLSRVQTGRPQHRHLQLQRRRRGKTSAAAHPRRQQRHSRSVPGFRGNPFCRAARRVSPRARNCSRTNHSARAISKMTGGDPQVVRVLFLAHCTREKGLFAAAQAVLAANRILSAQQSPVRMKLFAAGSFVINEEKAEFDQLLKNPEFSRRRKLSGICLGRGKGTRPARGGSVLFSHPLPRRKPAGEFD